MIQTRRDRERKLLAILRETALAGHPCPPMTELSQAVGYKGTNAWGALLRLESAGLLVLERLDRRVVVAFPELGIQTPNPRECRDGVRMRPIGLFIAVAAEISALTTADLTGRDRRRLYTRPRFLAARFARAEGWSTTQIGRALGGRDHSSIGSALRYADRWAECDPLFRRMLARMERRLAGIPEPAVPVLLSPKRTEPMRKRWAGDETAERSHQIGARLLLSAVRREHPERCAA